MEAVLDAVPDAVVTVDDRGDIVYANDAAERMFGYTRAELLDANIALLLPSERSGDGGLEGFLPPEAEAVVSSAEVSARGKAGDTIVADLTVSEVDGYDQRLLAGTFRDTCERRELEARLARETLYDPLTGLGTRTMLRDRLRHALDRLRRQPARLAVLYLDLDNFKWVNDSLGHAAGDRLLVEVAGRLRACVRPVDTLVRLGGDEFVIVCEDLPTEESASAVAERVIEAVQQPSLAAFGEVFVSTSVGIAFGDRAAEPDDMLRDADAAMYAAKSAGKSRYEVFDEKLREASTQRLRLQGALHHALQRKEFTLVYQPLVDLTAGEVRAVEALLRWRHPDRGLLAPAEFLQLAEESRLIMEIDRWVLSAACSQLHAWDAVLPDELSMWVNLSARSLADPQLPHVVRAACETAQVAPERLNLEITETVLMRDVAVTVRALDALKQVGVRLVVDDFGTGYSSLAYLRRFPVDAVKVTRAFVSELDQDEGNQAVVRAISGLASALGLDFVVEGLETPGETDAALRLDCQLGQGYFLGRPAAPQYIDIVAREGVSLIDSDLGDIRTAPLTVPGGTSGQA